MGVFIRYEAVLTFSGSAFGRGQKLPNCGVELKKEVVHLYRSTRRKDARLTGGRRSLTIKLRVRLYTVVGGIGLLLTEGARPLPFRTELGTYRRFWTALVARWRTG